MHPAMRSAEPVLASLPLVAPTTLDFTSVYDRWFDEVQRWVASMGAAEADVDDLTQEVFVIVDRKLPRFDGANLPGWIYGIARRVVARQRRRLWVKLLFLRRVDAEPHDAASATPATLLEQKQAQQTVAAVLARMSAKRRRVFVLFEIEGYTGEEIATLEGAPVKTIWTRLHHARKDFVRLASASTVEEQG